MKRIAFSAAAGILLAAAPAAARRLDYSRFHLSEREQTQRGGPDLAACIDRAAGSDTRASLCLNPEFERQDAALNRAYRAAMARQPNPTLRARLRSDQRSWLASRDGRCDRQILAQVGGPPETWGTLDRLSWRFCALSEIVRRTAWLERPR
jgi:uncharacterized protein YecT (DUF1311 family)